MSNKGLGYFFWFFFMVPKAFNILAVWRKPKLIK